MPQIHRYVAPLLLTALCYGCVEELVLPEPPNMSGLSERYDAPTAELSEATAERFLERFFERSDQLASVDDLEVVTRGMAEFAAVTEYGEDGKIEIDGVPINTDALLTLSGECFSFQLVVRQSAIVPVAWGALTDCEVVHRDGGQEQRLQFSAELSLFAPALADLVGPQLFLLSFSFSEISLDQEPLKSWAGSFRLADDLVEVLVEDDAGESLVFWRTTDDSTVGVRAKNGTWFCIHEERRCETPSSSLSFSF